jgi:hypothetical protein
MGEVNAVFAFNEGKHSKFRRAFSAYLYGSGCENSISPENFEHMSAEAREWLLNESEKLLSLAASTQRAPNVQRDLRIYMEKFL